MKEYSILIRRESDSPYILGTHPDIFSVKKAIQNLVDFEEERNACAIASNSESDDSASYLIESLVPRRKGR